MRQLLTIAACLIGGLAGIDRAVADDPGAAEQTVDFARDIRPILSGTCFKCHGPDEGSREADLRLDTFEGATADRGGYAAIVPGKPDESEAWQRLATDDEFLKMPPPDRGLELTPEQLKHFRQWIESGAKYEQHWAFRPVTRPAVPDVPAGMPPTAARQPLDRFILKELAAAGLPPSPEADRPTLIRRVYLDLLGLPPTPEETARFVNDARPDAYEQMLDRALASPHFGEKWGRHWLDQARYADTNGYTIDSERSIWPYRDWVIDAINADMPFDQFTIEQLAGDLLDEPSREQLVATGFHRNTLVNQEGGTDAEQFRNEAVVDRTNTTGAVWLGLTVGCAQCHTHKYDPLTQQEYYELFAFFNSSSDVNSVAPTQSVPSEQQTERLAELNAQLAEANAALAAYDREHPQRETATAEEAEGAEDKNQLWQTVRPQAIDSAVGASFKILEDDSILVSGRNGDEDAYVVTLKASEPITGVRLETLTHPSLPQNGPGRAGNGNFVLNEIMLASGQSSAEWLHATADHSQKDYDVTAAIDGKPETGWAINVSGGKLNVDRTATFVCSPLETEGQPATVTLWFGPRPAGYNIGCFRISVSSADPEVLGVPDPERQKLVAAVEKAQAAKTAFAKSIPSTMVMKELPKPRDSHVLIRGDFLRKGDPVRPDVPAFLPPLPAETDFANREDLARWLVDERNPLTPRVTVNRIWMRLFGQGLVETENDFGLQGTLPTHPELLDWLSDEFVRRGWSVKALLREILLSSTYRQSSEHREDIAEVDPLNKLLARQARIRVDAEIVRDLGLAASGLLDRTIGGKSVYPPQPDGVYAFTQRNAGWPTSKGPDRYRRGMYTFFMRSAPHPMLTTFDTPAFNTTCTRRVRSNTPLQSLTVANDEAMFEMAQALGRKLAEHPGSVTDRLQYGFQRCFSRAARAEEVEQLAAYFAAQRGRFLDRPEAAKSVAGFSAEDAEELSRRAAWVAVARVLINLDEFITRE